jgi:translocation and assembly module TamB
MQRIRSPAIIGLLAAALVGLAGLLALGAPSRAQSDQSILASFISRLLSTPGTQVQVGSIEGALSSNAVIRDLQISDRDGVWLKVDRARLVWKRTALLRGQLQVDALEIGRVEFARRSVSSGDAERAVSDEPVLPQLPVKAVVQRFTLAELVLGAPVLGTAARLAADGSASLGTPSEGLDLTFRATRLDAPGRATVGLGYVPQSNALRLDLVHDEPAGGLAARLLELPGLPPVALRISGEGPLTGFAARLNLAAGPTIGAEGEVRVARAGAAYRATLGLGAQVSGLVPDTAAPIFEGTTRLDGDVVVHDDGRIEVPGVRVAAPVAMVELAGTAAADRTLDLKITGRTVTSPGQRVQAGRAQIGALNIDLSVKGSPTLPQVSGTIAGAGLKLPQAALNKFNVRLDTSPSAGITTSDRLRVIAHATAEGLSLTDQALGRALGERIVVRARGTVDLAGDAAVEEAQIETPTGSAGFAGRFALKP